MKNIPIQNDFEFSIKCGKPSAFALYGNQLERMCDAKKLVDEYNYLIPNFRVVALNMIEKYNSNNNDRTILKTYSVNLLGNTFVADPKETGEITIINDINQNAFSCIRNLVLGLTPKTELIEGYSTLPISINIDEASSIYEQMKSDGKQYVTILSECHVDRLRSQTDYVLDKVLEGLFLGNNIEKKEFLEHARNIIRDKCWFDRTWFSCNPGDLKGINIPQLSSTTQSLFHFSTAKSINDWYDNILLMSKDMASLNNRKM